MENVLDAIPDPRHGWLAAVVPASARRFRTDDLTLAEMLRSAGAELQDRRADVEIVPARALRGDAAYGIVPTCAQESRSRFRLVRGSQRIVRATQVRVSMWNARRALARAGYGSPHVLVWQRAEPLALAGCSAPTSRRTMSHRFPLNAVAFAGTRAGATMLEAALADASRACSAPLGADKIFVGSSGVVVALGEREVVRVALGQARARLETQRAAIEWLARANLPDPVRAAVPTKVVCGESGLALWTVEPRLKGIESRPPLSERLMREGVDALAALHLAGRDGTRAGGPERDARMVAARCIPETGARVLELGARLEAELAHVPRGFAHGDFWSGNLLVGHDGSLAGIIDWAAASGGRLPLLDLLHLQISNRCDTAEIGLARAVVERAIDADQRDDAHVQGYLERIGLPWSGELSRSLLLAYWLAAAARGLADPDRPDSRGRREWAQTNVDIVLDELG